MQVRSVAVIGASGYTGAELLRLIAQHPALEVAALVAKRAAGKSLAEVFPSLAVAYPAARIEELAATEVAARAELAFLALPHGEAAEVAAGLLAVGVRVVDLSADFRLRDAAAWQAWYGDGAHATHPASNLIPEAVYGLPERYREKLRGARLVAAAGCYPTSTILPLAPLLAAQLISPAKIIVDAKSGVSGAGRGPGLSTHFPEIAEGLRAYKVAGAHRHTPEIEQELGAAAGKPLRVSFTPHLVPMARGILMVAYAEVADTALPEKAYRDCLAAAYADASFVYVLPEGQLPDTAAVRGSNCIHMQVALDARTGRLVVIAAIDNLVKGASGQAVQCANLMLGIDEAMGLPMAAVFP